MLIGVLMASPHPFPHLSFLLLRYKDRGQLLLSFLFELTLGQWQPTPVLLPGKSHGWRSLVGCGPWGR